MDFEEIAQTIRTRAEERRQADPEIVKELERLDKYAGYGPGEPDGDRRAMLEAELNLANLHFNPCQVVPGTRFSFFKKVVLRIARLFMTGQVQFNASSVRVLNELHKWVLELAEENVRLKTEQRDLIELVRLLEKHDFKSLAGTVRATPPVEYLRKEFLGSSSFPNSLAFLERFRGSEDTVRRQHQQYLELFRHHEPVVDLGCGRGEFVGLLAEAGLDVLGVESDPLLAEYARTKDLRVAEQDMFDYLESAFAGSIGGIFASQIIEHLEWKSLSCFLRLISEKLAVGGLLVLETINPVCLSVFAEGLYLDPTHVRPYHPAGISFLCENLGFSEVETRFSERVPEDHRVDRFSEYQHYAVIARK